MKNTANQSPSKIEELQKLFEVVARGKYLWERTFDAIQDPVLLIDEHYIILKANLATAQRAGQKIQSLIGKRCYESFAARQDVCPSCPLKDTFRERKNRSVLIEKLRPDGDFQVNSYPLSLEKKVSAEGPLVVHHYDDVTEERKLQKQLVQSEKMAAIGMLAGGVAHEINNPLAGILAFTQILKTELGNKKETTEAVKDLQEIEQAANRCKKIVEDLLLFARPDNGAAQDRIQLKKTVEEILPLAKLNFHKRDLSLEVVEVSSLPLIRGNSPRLQQVFLNLLNNAAQSMKEGGKMTLTFRVDEKRKEVIAEIQDEGSGIRPEHLSKIFDPFYTTKEEREGTGLGLSICDSIIREHGGRIEVSSRWGEGSIFRVVLPFEK